MRKKNGTSCIGWGTVGASWVLSATATHKLASWRGFASCHCILLLGICHRRKRKVLEACVREETHFCVLFLWPRKSGGFFQIAIQSREHIQMPNCPHKGLMHQLFYRGQFSLPRLPSGLEYVCFLSLWCTPYKLLSLSFCALFPVAQGCTQCPVVPGSGCPFSWLFAPSWTDSLANGTFCPCTC